MTLYRLTRKKHLETTLNGEGARLSGGRWNNKGTALVYTSEHPALALLELRVHIPPPTAPPLDYCMVVIDCPESSIKTIMPKELPSNWDSNPSEPQTREIGDQFAEEGNFLALRIPSAIVSIGYNVLLNPNHLLMREVLVVSSFPQKFDSRLFS